MCGWLDGSKSSLKDVHSNKNIPYNGFDKVTCFNYVKKSSFILNCVVKLQLKINLKLLIKSFIFVLTPNLYLRALFSEKLYGS